MTESAFSTTNTEAVAALRAIEADAYGQTFLAKAEELGFERTFYRDPRTLLFEGFKPPKDGRLPKGWRTRKSGEQELVVPDRRTAAGRDIVRWVNSVEPPAAYRLPGMPEERWVPTGPPRYAYRILHPEMFLIGRTVWVRWSIDSEALAKSDGMGNGAVDLSVWRERKLSEYHLAREKREAQREKANA